MKLTTISILFILLLSGFAYAQIPNELNYQGVLTDAVGDAVPDGTYSIVFRLYDVPSGGTHLWQETDPAVQVTKGIFNVLLGSITPLNLPFDEQYYLGISVEGEPELVPRIPLTSAAYAYRAMGVVGSTNYIPPTGDVGIGTLSPDDPLHVYEEYNGTVTINVENPSTGTASAEGIEFTDENGSNAGLRAFDPAHPTSPNYMHLYNNRTNGEIHLITLGQRRMVVNNAGDVGIGTPSPLERLDVNGGIKVGLSSGTNAGTIRWTGSDFEGYTGSDWMSFTDTGSGTLPAGANGYTLRHNGSDWVATSTIYNNGTQVGIGTTSPGAGLVLAKGGDMWNPSIGIWNTDSDMEWRMMVADDSDFHIVKLSGSTFTPFTATDEGYTGIMTTTPESKLHVAGGEWDLDNTEGDFKIGDATYRLKVGVATGGGGAGTAGIRVQGGAEKLILGAGSSEVLSVESDGTTSLGSSTQNANLEIFRDGSVSPVVRAYGNSYGGNIDLRDEAGNYLGGIEADASGQGGYLYVRRTTSANGFLVDGNFSSDSPLVAIYGASSNFYFRSYYTGDLAVGLPASSVGSSEIDDEPGVASIKEWDINNGHLETTVTVLASRSITVPDGGYVLVLSSCQASVSHTTGTTSSANLGVSNDDTAFPECQDVGYYMSSTLPTGLYRWPITSHGLFSVGAGTHTFYFLGQELTTASYYVNDVQLTLVYLPTAYGTVTSPAIVAGNEESDDNVGPKITAADIAAERAESIAANDARIQKELEDMRAEIEELRETVDRGNR